MELKLEFRVARQEDVGPIMEIIRSAQRRLAAAGIDQWQNGYPNRPRVEEDIACGYGRVLLLAGEVVGYAALTYDGERAYDDLTGGHWLTPTDGSYLTIHRLSVADKVVGTGLGRRVMLEAEREARGRVGSIRVDTHPDNLTMQGLIGSLGYRYCGRVMYESPRLAYEKAL